MIISEVIRSSPQGNSWEMFKISIFDTNWKIIGLKLHRCPSEANELNQPTTYLFGADEMREVPPTMSYRRNWPDWYQTRVIV